MRALTASWLPNSMHRPCVGAAVRAARAQRRVAGAKIHGAVHAASAGVCAGAHKAAAPLRFSAII